MNSTPNREKILLNLKWFVHRTVKSFEGKLTHALSRHASSGNISSTRSSPVRAPGNHLRIDVPPLLSENNELPLLRQLLEDQFHQQSNMSPGVESRRQSDLLTKKRNAVGKQKSPLMRIRSLTNSPLFRRLSFTSSSQSHELVSPEKFQDGSSQVQDEVHLDGCGNSTTEKLLQWPCSSNPQSPTDLAIFRRFPVQASCQLYSFYEQTSESQRCKWISSFAQQLCIIYEYQLSMLRGLTAIHAAADYVVDVVLKAIKLGKLTATTGEVLTPMLLFDEDCRPSSYCKCVKTIPLAITNEQLTWRLGEIWTLAGLRHNEVGGENCHNLSIVTHFLSAGSTAEGYSRSDIYGYRNLILFFRESQETDDNMNGSDSRQKTGSHNSSHSYYDIASNDFLTISSSKVKTGIAGETPKKNGYSGISDSKESSIPSNVSHYPKASPELSSYQQGRKQTHMSGASTIRQHLHRAYRPVFFVIYNRPSVIEHLTECDSFAAFCKRQSLSPVMFLNQPTSIFDEKPYPCIYQYFDLFNVTVSGYVGSDSSTPVPFSDVYSKPPLTPTSQNILKGSKNVIMSFPYLTQQNIAAYDNPGFAR
ncbi:hypothetical protein CSKR_105288 [Clonorchis sinensis]|uniref:Uncharacterized protein n=1 Tax=Clonorchis sinensis TaxID=79923 RepID=A0A419PMG3_CLOSI|nr:hypothetical protein CSKR_105288 [Clonorchis sinensis]